MLALLMSVAWAQEVPDEPSKEDHDGRRVVLGTLEGAGIGFLAGTGLGMLSAYAVAQSWENDACTDCDRSAFALLPLGSLLGIVTGATIGCVIATNRVHGQHLTLEPIGPRGPGLTVVATF